MDVVEKAIVFAVRAHEGQTRKLTGIPYILHPLEVANIIATMTDDRNTIAAGVLHDTIEECEVEASLIRALFGPRVAALVQSESEDKLSDRPPEETWRERKEESTLMLKHTKDIDVKILWLSDKLSNLRSFYREYIKSGDKIWGALHQKDPKMHAWYYGTVAESVQELSDTFAYREYIDLMRKLFGEDVI